MPESSRVIALGATAGLAAWEARRRLDARRIARDPEHAALTAPLRGRPLSATASDGTPLHAEAFGPEDAPTIVLVHGWTCSLAFWTYQIRALSQRFRVVACDLRGHGRSGTPEGREISPEMLAEDLDAVLDAALPDGGRAMVAGHSLGAMTIVAWAHRHHDASDERIAGAALLNTGMGDLITETLVVRTPTALGRMRQAVGTVILSSSAPLPRRPNPVTHAGVRFVALNPDASPAHVAFSERMILASRAQVRGGCGRMLSRLDLRDGVASLRVPTLVLAGERDKLTPPAHARRLAEWLPDCRELVEVPRVGHMAPLEAHREVCTALEAHAERCLPATAEQPRDGVALSERAA